METTLHNVLAFKTVLDKGHNPRDHRYQREGIPTGEYKVTLNFMVWANKMAGIDLYFTLQQTGQHIRLTAFRDPEETIIVPQSIYDSCKPYTEILQCC